MWQTSVQDAVWRILIHLPPSLNCLGAERAVLRGGSNPVLRVSCSCRLGIPARPRADGQECPSYLEGRFTAWASLRYQERDRQQVVVVPEGLDRQSRAVFQTNLVC